MLDNIKKNSLLKKINTFWQTRNLQNINTANINGKATFALVYKNLLIGTLVFDKGEWIFNYSKDFKEQNKINSIIDFPVKEKVYKTNDLWPFFINRIPSTNQPQVKAYLAKKQTKENDLVSLLKKFGKRTITTPFILEVQ